MPGKPFAIEETAIEGLLRIRLKQFTDDRGTIREYFRAGTYSLFSPSPLERCNQINVTYTRKGAVRGLHGENVSKLLGVVSGEAFGAWVDARSGSSTYGTVVTEELRLGYQILVPRGVLNGFQATSDEGCEYLYGFDEEWRPDMPGVGVNPLDPALAIPWPLPIDATNRAQISEKDSGLPPLSEVSR